MSHTDHPPLNTPERMLLVFLRTVLQQTDADWKACSA